MKQLMGLAVGVVLLAGASVAQERREWEENVTNAPGPVQPDVFYPGFDPATDEMPEPRKGGRVIVHLSTLPKNMNYMVENSAVTRWMQYETHEYLVLRDWETWEYEPVLAAGWVEEDTVILKDASLGFPRPGDGVPILYGRVTETDGGWRVEPLSKGNSLGEARVVPKDAVKSVERETVFTFDIRPNVKWHDGRVLDSRDCTFTFASYLNPAVECDAIRFKWQKFSGCEAIDDLTVRFFAKQQYFLALDAFTGFCILPSHLYDLCDPDHAKHDPKATDEKIGAAINEHKNNTMWIGTGPYRITAWNDQYVEAQRFDGYFNPADSGYVDTIRWRHISSDPAAKQALINGDLDYWDRLRPEDYVGEFTKQAAFTDHYYKGYSVFAYLGYTGWNMRRHHFEDPLVRRALAYCFDLDDWIDTVMEGLGSRITGPAFYFGRNYDHSVEPITFSLDTAEELLIEAGWYDSDGDDIIDKDGVPFEFEFLTSTGNTASEMKAQKFQENLAKVGIKMNISTLEWATFLERLYDGNFDCCSLSWVLSIEDDPEQLWHSRWADPKLRSSNRVGFADEKADALIEAIQVELDDAKRAELFHEFHRHLYELQPYSFDYTLPKKYAMSKRIRNYRSYAVAPHYRIREWYVVEPDGATREAGAER